jgi:hypothetical protein
MRGQFWIHKLVRKAGQCSFQGNYAVNRTSCEPTYEKVTQIVIWVHLCDLHFLMSQYFENINLRKVQDSIEMILYFELNQVALYIYLLRFHTVMLDFKFIALL